MNPFFSIIVVCLQAGEELRKTVESVLSQTDTDFEVIVKDGGSTDGSVERLPDDGRLRVFCRKDTGIYDAMNQAAQEVRGRYVLFLNCGDYLYDADVLENVHRAVAEHSGGRKGTERCGGREKTECRSETRQTSLGKESSGDFPAVFYGNTYERAAGSLVMSNPRLNAFGCYRNVPCHQSCFYHASLIRPDLLAQLSRTAGGARACAYETRYPVRADYEHFLWCFFRAKAETVYMPVTVCSYEGGGFSESGENRARAKKEHREITALYMTGAQRFCYRTILILTLAPLRTRLSQSRRFSGIYQGIKRALYGRRS